MQSCDSDMKHFSCISCVNIGKFVVNQGGICHSGQSITIISKFDINFNNGNIHNFKTFDTDSIEPLEFSLMRKTNVVISKRSVYQTTNLRVIDTEFLWLSWFANHYLLNLCSPCKTIWRSELLLINIYSGFKCNDNW